MKTVEGFKYRAEGKEDLNEFAKGILILTNAMSSRKDTVIDIKTQDGTNDVIIHSLIDIDDVLNAHFKSILSKDKIEVLQLDYDDLTGKTQGWITRQEESDQELAQDYFLSLPTNLFW